MLRMGDIAPHEIYESYISAKENRTKIISHLLTQSKIPVYSESDIDANRHVWYWLRSDTRIPPHRKNVFDIPSSSETVGSIGDRNKLLELFQKRW